MNAGSWERPWQPSSRSWWSMWEQVKDRFEVLLDGTLKKDALIAKAVQLEAEHDA
jgi:hypothetical protein